MSYFKELACFLDMDLCYMVLNISCCFLTYQQKSDKQRGRTFWVSPKNPVFGLQNICFMQTLLWCHGNSSFLHQIYLNSWQLSNFECAEQVLYIRYPILMFLHILYQLHMLTEQQILLPTLKISKISTLFSKNNQFQKIACKAKVFWNPGRLRFLSLAFWLLFELGK